MSKSNLEVHLYVTPRCNLACPHCYYDAYDRKKHPSNLISLNDISYLLNGLHQYFSADISLEGGEPFLRVGLDRMLAELDAEVLKLLTVTTNGTVSIRSDADVLRRLGQLRVSVDGHTDELQQELRGTALEPVMACCRRLDDDAVPFWIRMTLWKRNVRSLAEIYAWAQASNIRRISFFEFQSSGRAMGLELLYGVSGADIETFLNDLIEVPRPRCLELVTLNLAERRVDLVLAQRTRLEEAGIAVVELAEIPNCTINYDGTVGISPWRVTANGAADVFTSATSPGFFEVLSKAAADGSLRDVSGCISRVQLRLGG